MEIRNWNEIIGENGIRIDIEIFFRMEITLVEEHSNASAYGPRALRTLATPVLLMQLGSGRQSTHHREQSANSFTVTYHKRINVESDCSENTRCRSSVSEHDTVSRCQSVSVSDAQWQASESTSVGSINYTSSSNSITPYPSTQTSPNTHVC